VKEPDDKRLLRCVNSVDRVGLVIKTHQLLDTLLTLLISEAVERPRAVEVCRISVPLKIDLVVALGWLPPESRPLVKKLTAIRNRFAHQRTRFSKADARDLFNTLSASHRSQLGRHFEQYESPLTVLRECFTVSFLELQWLVIRSRDSKAEGKALSKMAKEAISMHPEHVRARERYGADRRRTIQAIVLADRAEREKSGRL